MKKIILTNFSALLFLGLLVCSNQNEQESIIDQNYVKSNELERKVFKKDDVREIVWRQLSSNQKEWIDDSWRDGKVSKILLNENMTTELNDISYEGKEVYMIDFPTKTKSIPDNIIVYADVITFAYIGNGLVD
ncbi:hypothetical protein [Metabacillus litoralis]|uniref:hypothetical protein n=1 Tax=Metabacillus litoralis TaxID=152268 RepID=UPI001CFD903D|nr:hypothetical protein [Metabacillus litoralis]